MQRADSKRSRCTCFPEKQGGGAQCEVKFKSAKLSTSLIPDFGVYQESLQKALGSWSKKQQVRSYLEQIKKFAEADEVDVLYVIDNGKGFDAKGLEAVLSEGSPEKEEGSSGSHGVGHLTAFGLSGLQFVFYFGKQQSGEMLAAGHAILSSFKGDNKELCSCSGYYLKDHQPTFDDPYTFCDKDGIPEFLLQEAAQIKDSGSIVAILGFKGFAEEADFENGSTDFNEHILQAVAENFAIAISSNELSVAAIEQICPTRIIHYLETRADKSKQALQALESVRTFKAPDEHGKLDEEFEDCQIFLRNKTSFDASIWRNGMLISRNYWGLTQNHFVEKKPFNAVIFLSGKENPRVAHDIVKKAETPLHDKIMSTRLETDDEKKTLAMLMKNIRSWLNQHSVESGGDFSDLDDEILLGNGAAPIFRRPPSTSFNDDDDNEEPAVPEPPGGNGNGNGNGNGKPKKKVKVRKDYLYTPVQGVVSTQNPCICRVKFKPGGNMAKAIIEFQINSGQDPSCAGWIDHDDLNVVNVPSVAISGNKLQITEDGIEVRNLRKGTPVIFDIEFKSPIPQDVSINFLLGKISSRK